MNHVRLQESLRYRHFGKDRLEALKLPSL